MIGNMMAYRISSTIHFYSLEKSGRTSALPIGKIGYILQIEDSNISCYILNDGSKIINPGDEVQMDLVIMSDEIFPIKIGSEFFLKDYRIIARGVVNKLML